MPSVRWRCRYSCPALPAIREHFSAPVADTQWVISGFSVALAASMLAYGPVSDRYGRRRVVLVGLTLFCVGSAVCYQAESLAVLILGRVVQAMGVAAGSTMGRAVAADVVPPEKLARAVSFMTMALVMGPMLAPVIAGYLVSTAGWRSIALLLGACSALPAAHGDPVDAGNPQARPAQARFRGRGRRRCSRQVALPHHRASSAT